MIAAIDLVSVCCDAFAIHSLLRSVAKVSYRRVFAAEASGLAINRLTPGNSLGEPLKVALLAPDVPTDVAVAAVLMFNLMTMYVAVAAIAIGVPLTVLLLDLPHDLAVGVWIATAVVIAFALALALVIRRGAVGSLIGALRRVRAISDARETRWRARIAGIDTRVRALGNLRAAGIGHGFLGVIGSRLCNWAGTLVVLKAIAIPLTPPLVIAMFSVGIVVTWMSNVIPLGLGLADGTNYALYGVLGASASAGLVFTMVNRVRTVMLALMGLTTLATAKVIHSRV